MKIAIIGTGNVGGVLAQRFAEAGHSIYFGVRNVQSEKNSTLPSKIGSVHSIKEAALKADVVVIATPAQAAVDVAKALGDLSNLCVIDATNAVGAKPEGFSTTAHAVLSLCNTKNVVKCFNTTGAEVMRDPKFGRDAAADLFVAGDSKEAKSIATKLAQEIGFKVVYDFGGNDKFELIEKLALCWINLAMMQGYGRNIAFKVLKKD